MGLTPGTRLGHYTIGGRLGAGGMGEVYRGRDTRLNRDVAIKIIPDHLTGNTERLARFSREAQTLAALTHPHIARVYGFEESGDTLALVMELVEGEDLARRIERGRVPVREAMAIARQIADALEAAHDRGIVHRDLKPSNIMLDAEGGARVLDFGLATTVPEPADDDSASAPTLTSPAKLTKEGVVVGTPAYMSPEQVTGRPADKRCDVWAFGCVVFELLTGHRAFDGTDTHDVMMAIASKEPDWSRLPKETPNNVVTLVKRCLDKNRKRRLSDMSAARLELEEAIQAPLSGVQAVPAAMPSPRRLALVLPWAIAALAMVVAAAAWLTRGERDAELRPLARVTADVGAPVSLATSQGASVVLSPDGRRLIFAAQPRAANQVPRLYTRTLDELTAVPLPGTEGALNPFFSPDGQSVGFFAGGKLKKIAIGGGPAIELADAPNARGGSWGDDDFIVFMPDINAGLWRIAASGGEAVQLTTPAIRTGTHRWPQVLPGSKAVIFTSNPGATAYENAEIVLQPLPTGPPRVIQKGGMYPQYVASGHLIFMRQGSIFAAPFDLAKLERTGEALPIIEDVANGALWTGSAQFAASATGIAAYLPGTSFASTISVLDATGSETALRQEPVNWGDPAFSPDGRRLAFDIFDGRQSDIWIYDLADQSLSRLTHSPNVDAKPVWSPDGKRIAFIAIRDDGGFSVAWHWADGSGRTQPLIDVENLTFPTSFHPSGRYLAYGEVGPKTSGDLKVLPLEALPDGGLKPGTPIPLATTSAVEVEAMFSPDGRWIAFSSTVSGRSEIYVKPFPGPGGTWQVSADGGTFPTWSKTTNELMFSTLDQRLMTVSYTADALSFRARPPRIWSNQRHRLLGPIIQRNYDLHPDGKRVVFARTPDATEKSSDPVVMVFNFFDELQRRVPSSKR